MLFRYASCEQQSLLYLPINQGGEGLAPRGFALLSKNSIAISIPPCHHLLVPHPIFLVPGQCKSLRSDNEKSLVRDFLMIFHYLCLPFPCHIFLDCAMKFFRCISTTSCIKRYLALALKMIC